MTRFAFRRFLAAALVLLHPAAHAGDGLPEGWCLSPLPTFERPAVARPIAGAHRTAMAVSRVRDGLLVPATRAEFEALGMEMDEFVRRAARSASALLATLEPEIRRDRRRVAEAAVLSSADPRLPMVVLDPGFAAKFRPWFGSPVFVAIPNQSELYVFPSIAGSYEDYGPMLVGAYRNSPRPVSLELFELGRPGALRAVGCYEP